MVGPRGIETAETASFEGRLFVLDSFFRLIPHVLREQDLLSQLCDLLVKFRPYPLAWIGRAQPDGSVEVLARAGAASDYVQNVEIRWDDTPRGRGTVGLAIATHAPVMLPRDDPAFTVWRAQAERFGIRATLAFPFKFEDQSQGVLVASTGLDPHVLEDEIPFLELVTGLIRMRQSVALQEARADRRLQRLETLWRLTLSPGWDDDDRLRAILAEGALALGQDFQFKGLISHVEDEFLVIDSTTIEAPSAPFDHLPVHERPTALAGDRLPLSMTMSSHVVSAGGTCAWEDLVTHPEFASTGRVVTAQWRSAVGTLFKVGDRVHCLLFLSKVPARRPFDDEDRAYVELLASFFAHALLEKEQESQIRFQAQHDALTGLGNRAQFRDRLAESIAATASRGGRCALILMDLDDFKEINDTYGHLAGDAALLEVADRLRMSLCDGEFVARLGGDEFAIVVPDASDGEKLENLVRRVCDALTMPLASSRYKVRLKASVGIGVCPDHGASLDVLFGRTDAAMYRAKAAGGARYQFFSADIEAAMQRRRRLQQELRDGLEREEFVLHFQPEIDLRTRAIAGAEALIRWNHPERGLLRPEEFLPFAEELDLMGAIGDWVMRETLRQAPKLAPGNDDFRVFFNLSALQMNDSEFAMQLTDELLRSGTAGARIGVEVTENIAMRDPQLALETLGALRKSGMFVALDDFGTGRSSLSHLKTLPIDVIKIDRSFIQGIPTDGDDAAIVEAVISFAHKLGRTVLAEGIETIEQARWLSNEGCHLGQGYYYAQPITAEAFPHWLRSYSHATA